MLIFACPGIFTLVILYLNALPDVLVTLYVPEALVTDLLALDTYGSSFLIGVFLPFVDNTGVITLSLN